MRRFVTSVLIILVAATPASAQDVAAVEQQVERLRAQLREVADKETELQVRARQLDEDLRPENIQRSVAHVGTTDAQALRDERRRQLERQKAGVEEQLASLATSRGRLESAIATAEAEAVRLRAAALGASNAPVRTETAAPTKTPSVVPAAPAARKRQKGTTRAGKKRVKRGKPRRRAASR